jgi:C4-dicarboxylate-specific signal transduction histidine kinase
LEAFFLGRTFCEHTSDRDRNVNFVHSWHGGDRGMSAGGISHLKGLVMRSAIGSLAHKLFAWPSVRIARLAASLAGNNLQWGIDDRGKDGPDALGKVCDTTDGVKQAAETLERENKTIEARVEERAVKLERLTERLRQTQFELMQHEKMSMLGQLASGVAHEVNTPTGAILNASVDAGRHLREVLALAMDPEGLSADMRKWLGEMFGALFREGTTRGDMAVRNERRQMETQLREAGHVDARRMAEVIVAYGKPEFVNDEESLERLSQGPVMAVLEHVLALKVSSEISEASAKKIARIVRSLRLYAHSGQGEPSDIDVNESVDNMLVVMQNRIKHVARVETRFRENMPSVKCGADLLQVWTNILSNACDAIATARGERLGLIEVVTDMDDENVIVKISNDGPPITEEHMAKLFTPFFTTKGLGQGTGLGLSICAGILKRYGGVITAANGPGRVTFEVRLPKTPCPSKNEEAAVKAPARILAVPAG